MTPETALLLARSEARNARAARGIDPTIPLSRGELAAAAGRLRREADAERTAFTDLVLATGVEAHRTDDRSLSVSATARAAGLSRETVHRRIRDAS